MAQLVEFVQASLQATYTIMDLGNVPDDLTPIILEEAGPNIDTLALAEAMAKIKKQEEPLEKKAVADFLVSRGEDEKTAEGIAAFTAEYMTPNAKAEDIKEFRNLFAYHTAHLVADAWVCALIDSVGDDHRLRCETLDSSLLPPDVEPSLKRYFENVIDLTLLAPYQIRAILSAYRKTLNGAFLPKDIQTLLSNADIPVTT